MENLINNIDEFFVNFHAGLVIQLLTKEIFKVFHYKIRIFLNVVLIDNDITNCIKNPDISGEFQILNFLLLMRLNRSLNKFIIVYDTSWKSFHDNRSIWIDLGVNILVSWSQLILYLRMIVCYHFIFSVVWVNETSIHFIHCCSY